jgi:flagellar basal body-associated protein FliL
MGGLAHAIGARNLKIAIVAMPLVFLVVIALIILILGKKDKAAPIERAAVIEEPAATDATEIA